jgi:hypothetical protein
LLEFPLEKVSPRGVRVCRLRGEFYPLVIIPDSLVIPLKPTQCAGAVAVKCRRIRLKLKSFDKIRKHLLRLPVSIMTRQAAESI